MAEEILSKEDCEKILQNYYKDPSVKYSSHKINTLSDNCEGFMGEHYQLQITYQKNGESNIAKLFVKTKPVKNKIQADIVSRSPLYVKEIFLYDHLFKEFDKYGFDTSFAPQLYYCIDDLTLVLDDLNTKNFILHPRHESFTLDDIKCVLKSLALYHGAGFAYERIKTKELGREFHCDQEFKGIFDELFFYLYTNPVQRDNDRFWKGNFELMDALIDLLPKEDSYKKEFKHMIQEVKLCSTFAQEFDLPKTCGHGDLWSNNMMFKYNNGIAQKCCLIDFQIVRYNCPSIDVILAIYSNTSAELRRQHLKEMYQFYYDNLSEILDNYGYKISEVLPLDDYYRSIEIYRHEVLAQVTALNAIVRIPKKVLTDSVKKNDDSFDDILHDKIDLCKDVFKNDDIFKKVMTESLYDLHDALVTKLRK